MQCSIVDIVSMFIMMVLSVEDQKTIFCLIWRPYCESICGMKENLPLLCNIKTNLPTFVFYVLFDNPTSNMQYCIFPVLPLFRADAECLFNLQLFFESFRYMRLKLKTWFVNTHDEIIHPYYLWLLITSVIFLINLWYERWYDDDNISMYESFVTPWNFMSSETWY